MQSKLLDDEIEIEFNKVVNKLKKTIFKLIALIIISSCIVYILNLLFFLYFTIGIFGGLLVIQLIQSLNSNQVYFFKLENSALTLNITNLLGEKFTRTFKEKDVVKAIFKPIENSINYELILEFKTYKNEYIIVGEMVRKELIPTLSKEWKNITIEKLV